MAALVACASLRSYNRDVCVAPFATRCMLLDERVARSSCSSSQLGSDAPAVTTASGLFPRLPSLSVWVGARNSSAEVLHCRVEGVSASICALLGRQFGGRRIELGQQADNPEPRRQGNPEPRQPGSYGETLLLWFVAIPCYRLVADLFWGRGVDQNHARHLIGISGGVRSHVQTAEGMANQHVRPWRPEVRGPSRSNPSPRDRRSTRVWYRRPPAAP
jgi:hypothetical protein